MMEQFLAFMGSRGWKVKSGKTPSLPKEITQRYHNIPDLWLQFTGTVSELCSRGEKTWFLCAADYDSRLDHTWRWNEWEQLSLDSAQGDDLWSGEIRAFWDNHLPIVMSLEGGYSYYAISMADGCVVYGTEPEFEVCQPAASSFPQFLEQIMDGTIQLEKAPA